MKTKIMSPWKKVLIVAFSIIAFAVLVIACLTADAYYEKYHKSHYWENLARPISANILMVEGYRGGREFVRLKDIRTDKFITPKLQHIFINEFATEDSLVVFRTFDRLRGYINVNTGKIIIPAQYNRAWNFSEGMAAVLKDGIISFINSDGKPAFDATFPIYYQDDYNSIAPQFHNGLCVMRSAENKWGMINTRGEWAIEPIYNSIDAPLHGFRIAQKGDKYGVFKADGSLALPFEYDLIRFATDKRGFIIAKDGYAQEVDWNFKMLVPFVYDGLRQLYYVCNYRDTEYYDEAGNLHAKEPKYWRYDIGPLSGVMDSKGKVIIPAKYYMIHIVNDDLFEVDVTSGGDCILINSKGQYVGKCE